ncbi:MAG: response regulator transcription factor [Microthrixaceae bacterium]
MTSWPNTAPDAPRVVVVDDHALFRAGVVAELGDRVEVVGVADDVTTAIEVIHTHSPDVVLLDVHLPGGDGAAVMAGCGDLESVRFLALSVSDSADDVIALVRAGARGYVTKSISAEDLCDAVVRVAAGDAVFSPRLAGFVLDAFSASTPPSPNPELDQLTTREGEVLRLLARGYAYKEIARELTISIKTVESHASAVLRKLQLSNRRELTRWASERRLV